MAATPSSSGLAAVTASVSPPTIMSSDSTARPRVVALPREMVAKVLSDVEIDRATLVSAMRSNKEMFDQAVRLYWVLSTPQTVSSENFLR